MFSDVVIRYISKNDADYVKIDIAIRENCILQIKLLGNEQTVE